LQICTKSKEIERGKIESEEIKRGVTLKWLKNPNIYYITVNFGSSSFKRDVKERQWYQFKIIICNLESKNYQNLKLSYRLNFWTNLIFDMTRGFCSLEHFFIQKVNSEF